MSKNLVIVESPAKAKTIEKFLGSDFKVVSSFGHISDLPLRDIGVDVEKNFKPNYVVSDDKKEVVKKLKELSGKAEMIWLASDEDREGEAIAWHLSETLKLKPEKTKRIVFNQITKNAILKAIENPREIDYNLVNAQQARRVLDRLVGYELSPVLWKKIKTGLSAGRVQSVAVRLIVEREREIIDFKTVSTYRVDAVFTNKEGRAVKAQLAKSFDTKEAAVQFLQKQVGAQFKVADLEKKPAKKTPAAPFTTSTLQQEAARKLSFPVAITMRVAQRLYEEGLITYMRTDSVNLSKEAIDEARNEITKSFGKQYAHSRNFNTKTKGAQEAHEAIRPTDISRSRINLDADMSRLYDLIWKRTIASQMSDAELERTLVKISSNKSDEVFSATGEIIVFDGFLKVYLESTDEERENEPGETQEGLLPNLTIGEPLSNQTITATQRYSRPPSRYTEASLVKKLEELGIGRPSTYAPTISTIQNRTYVEKGIDEGAERFYQQLVLKDEEIAEKKLKETTGSSKGKLVPTDIGYIVNDFLLQHFTDIIDYNFTAKVEEDFDEIASGNQEWTSMMDSFYKVFHPKVLDVEKNAERESGERILGEDPVSGKQISVRLGKFGPMAQIGSIDDEDKKFASLRPEQNIGTLTIEEALDLFKLPRTIGTHKSHELVVNIGRFGPYVKFDKTFVSIPKDIDPLEITLQEAIGLIDQKIAENAPVASYQSKPVQKGKGRFGPYLKWDDIFINVSKKYDFDNLSQADIEELIEDKIQKNKDKIIREWKEEGIKIEKDRYGKPILIKGKVKKPLNGKTNPETMTLEEAQELLKVKSTAKKAKTTKAKK